MSSGSLTSLINQLNTGSSTKLDFSKFLEPLTSAKQASTATGVSSNSASLGLKNLSTGTDEKLNSIKFGKPSSNVTTSSSSGFSLSSLLGQTASGGIASALTGGLSSVTGIGGLFSDLTKLFGGSKAAPPPLALFSLPNSIQQTAYVSSSGVSLSGNASTGNSSITNGAGIYSSSGTVSNPAQTSVQAAGDSATIAQAVKTALLTSNTLGDVISEL